MVNKAIKDYIETQNKENKKTWKIINIKLLVLIAITLSVPIICDYFGTDNYIFWLGVTIYVESFFIYFIKKLVPRINLSYILVIPLLTILYLYQTRNGWERMGPLVILLFSPILCGISYFGGHLITTIILTIQRTVKKEKIYDEEMKKYANDY